MSPRIGIIGFGRLGEALAIYFANRGYTCVSYSRHPGAIERNGTALNPITFLQSNVDVVKESDVIVLAVKPKDFGKLSLEIRDYITKDKLILSCMALITIAKIAENLGTNLVVRCMPSIGIAHVEKMIPFFSFIDHEVFAEKLFGTAYLRLRRENELDTATIIGSCSPAIFAYIAECFQAIAGERCSMDEHSATILICHAMSSAAHEMMVNGPSEVIRKVASPGGLTESIINTLMKADVHITVCSALDAALTQIENSK